MKRSLNKLIVCLALDAVGYISYGIPMFDVIWAPLSAFILYKMFTGYKAKTGAVIQFIEEALPFTDFIPTFTLTFMVSLFVSPENDNKKSISG